MISIGGDQKYSYPFLYWFMAPLKYIFNTLVRCPKYRHLENPLFHHLVLLGSWHKSNIVLPLIFFWDTYYKSNSVNRINHLDNLPFKAGFSNSYLLKPCSYSTTHSGDTRALAWSVQARELGAHGGRLYL